jgi:hypothetical protein
LFYDRQHGHHCAIELCCFEKRQETSAEEKMTTQVLEGCSDSKEILWSVERGLVTVPERLFTSLEKSEESRGRVSPPPQGNFSINTLGGRVATRVVLSLLRSAKNAPSGLKSDTLANIYEGNSQEEWAKTKAPRRTSRRTIAINVFLVKNSIKS